MSFSQNYYVGTFEQNEITFSDNIILDTGYKIGTEFELIGGTVLKNIQSKVDLKILTNSLVLYLLHKTRMFDTLRLSHSKNHITLLTNKLLLSNVKLFVTNC